MEKNDIVGHTDTHDAPLRVVPAEYALLFTDFARLEQCPAAGSLTLEGAPKEKPTFPMWRGIFVHRFLEYAALRGREEALAYVSKKKLRGLYAMCAAIDVYALPEGRVELGLAYDPSAGTVREVSKGRWHVEETEWAGRLDLLSEKEGCPHVVDYKTGDISHSNPGLSPQLLGGALGARALFVDPWGLSPPGAEKPRGVFVSLAQVARDGEVRWRTAFLGEEELDQFDQRTRHVQLEVLNNRRRIKNGDPVQFQAGPACPSCELFAVCPATAELQARARSLPGDDQPA